MLKKFPSVEVDMGAVKFMCKGANLMRPGIKKFTEFEKGKLVCIVEETHHKFLAVGKSMVSSSELENMDKGEVIQNTHYVSINSGKQGKRFTINKKLLYTFGKFFGTIFSYYKYI